MSILDDFEYLAPGFIDNKTKVSHHTRVTFVFVVPLDLSNILVDPFPMLIAHCS